MAFVQFEDKDSAVKALELKQITIAGRHVYIKTIEQKREMKPMVGESKFAEAPVQQMYQSVE